MDTPDRSIVISGDTAPTEAVVQNCHGCDVLIHEIYNDRELTSPHLKQEPGWATYLQSFHTSATELGELAARAKPGELILYHQIFADGDEADLVKKVTLGFKGKVSSAKDLDVY